MAESVEIKLLKLAMERLIDQVGQLSTDLELLRSELSEMKKSSLGATAVLPQVVTSSANEYIDIKEAQEILGVCYNSLRKIIDDGYIKPIRINQRRVRFNKADIIGYLQREH